MMEDLRKISIRCPYCGCILCRNSVGDYICPNCGIVGCDYCKEKNDH